MRVFLTCALLISAAFCSSLDQANQKPVVLADGKHRFLFPPDIGHIAQNFRYKLGYESLTRKCYQKLKYICFSNIPFKRFERECSHL